MKLQFFRIWAVLACGALCSCSGKSSSHRNQAGSGGMGGGVSGAGGGAVAGSAGTAGTDAGEAGEGPSTGGSSGGGSAGSAGDTAAGNAGSGGDSTTPAGGSSGTAGTEQGGMGATGGALAPIEGCTRMGTSVQADGCVSSLQCPGIGYYGISCTRRADGSSVCNCTDIRSDYEVSGLSGVAVCDTIAVVCVSGEGWSFDGPRECSLTVERREAAACELKQTCTQSLTIGDNVTAVNTVEYGVSCYDYGDGYLSCLCDYGPAFFVEGKDGTEACDALFGPCVADTPIEFEGEPTCTAGYGTGSEGSCTVIPLCERRLDLGNGVTAAEFNTFEINCWAMLDTVQCACSFEGYTAFFDTDAVLSDEQSCGRYVELCAGHVAPVAASSEVECVPNGQQLTAAGCNATFDCAQRATFDGEQLVISGSLVADCAPAGDGYVCACSSFGDSVQIEVAASTAWDACTAARTECPNRIEPTIGDGVILPPVPPPSD